MAAPRPVALALPAKEPVHQVKLRPGVNQADGPVLAAALQLAAKGMPIFPCDPNPEKPFSKRPLIVADKDESGKSIVGTGWPKKASCDEAQIRAWWRRWPKAMIGCSPGRMGAFVVDLDPKGEPVDLVERRLEEAIGGPVPDGPRTLTQSGGLHLWFARPEGDEWGNYGPGLKNIDIRCDNGYVIVPPSMLTNGKSYVWQGEGKPLPAVPPKLLELIAARREAGKAAPGNAKRTDNVVNLPASSVAAATIGYKAKRAYARAGLDAERDKVAIAIEGTRGLALFGAAAAAGRLIAAGAFTEREAAAVLEEAAELCGLVKADGLARVRRDIRNGINKGRGDAGDTIRRLEDIAREAERRAQLRGAKPPAPAGPDDYGFPVPAPPDAFASSAPAPPAEWAEIAASSQMGAPVASDDTGAGGKPPRRAKRSEKLDRRLASLARTDLGNAERFVERHGKDFRWCPEIGWLAWDGKRWSLAAAEGLLKIATHDTIRSIINEAKQIEDTEDDIVVGMKGSGKNAEEIRLSDALKAWWLSSQGAGHIACLPALVGPYIEAAVDDFDQDDFKICLQNGVLEIDKAHAGYVKFRPHRRDDLITKILPVAYDPKAQCPVYDDFLAFVQPETRMRRFLHQWGGYSLVGDTSEQALVFFHGKGKNGKSTLVDIWAHIAGDLGCSIPIETFVDAGRARASGQATPELAMLAGARFLRTSEPERGAKLAEAMIKLATGGEEMKVRHLNKDFFTLHPKFKLLMSGNYRPQIDGTDEGIWRRVNLVPWSVMVPVARRDKHLGKKLRAEASGVLNRLLDGLRDWLDNGLSRPDEVVEATESYRSQSDPLGRFLEICTKPTVGRRTQSSVLHRLFVAWAKVVGEREWSAKGLAKAMSERGFKQKHSDVMWWLDLETIKVPEDFVDVTGSPRTVNQSREEEPPPLDPDPF